MAVGVVVAQSKSTAHVYRVFGALVVLLLIMGLALGLTRMHRSQPPASPYGGLMPVTTSVGDAGAIATRPSAVPGAPAAVVAQPDPAHVASGSLPTAASTVSGPDATRQQPRVIAMSKMAMGETQPAPAVPVTAPVAIPPAPAPAAAQVAAVSPAPTPIVAQAQAADNPTSDGMININSASAEVLNNLPGVGRIGKTIVRHRPYASINDLVDHRVLKSRDFARIKSMITTN